MRDEQIRNDLEGTWSTVVDIKEDDGYRVSLEFDGSEQQLEDWLPDEYEVVDAVETGDGGTRAMLRLD